MISAGSGAERHCPVPVAHRPPRQPRRLRVHAEPRPAVAEEHGPHPRQQLHRRGHQQELPRGVRHRGVHQPLQRGLPG